VTIKRASIAKGGRLMSPFYHHIIASKEKGEHFFICLIGSNLPSEIVTPYQTGRKNGKSQSEMGVLISHKLESR